MATLYEIDERLRALEDMLVDIETGEIIEDENRFNELFDEIAMDLNSKIENTICYIKSLDSDVESFKEEQKKLMQRRKVKENLAERLRNRIDTYIKYQFTDDDGNVDLDGLNKFKMESPRMKISYRKSDSVNITDISKIPSDFIKERVITENDIKKSDIKKVLKTGTVEGAELVTKMNMQIK